MTFSRSNAELALLALAFGAGSLTNAFGTSVMGLALHPPGQHGWSGFAMIAVGLYPLGWIGFVWSPVELWTRWRRKMGKAQHALG